MVNASKITLSLIYLLILNGCTQNVDKKNKKMSNTDLFYTVASGFDYSRFPVIKPYEAMTINDGSNWNIGLKDDIGFSCNVLNVKKLNVINGLIVVYSNNSTMLNSKKVYEAWFAINPITKKEKGFETEKEFLNYLKKEGIEKPNWKDVNAVFNQFAETYCLDWIPHCK